MEIYNIHLDDNSRLWFVTQSGIYIYQNGKLSSLETEMAGAKILRNVQFNTVTLTWDTNRKGFWVGGYEPCFIDYRNKAIYHRLNNPDQIPIFNDTEVSAIAVDRKSNIWYANGKTRTLNFWDQNTNRITKYDHLDGERIFDGCNYIFIDKKDRVWISTWAFAAYLKQPGEPIRKIPYSQNRKYSIGYGFFWTAIEDAEGNIWLGTLNGISKVQANAPVQAIYHLPSFKYFMHTGFAHSNSIVVDGDTIMAAKEDGIVKFDMKTRNYHRYVSTYGPDLLKNKFFMSLKSGGRWWFAGLDGIHYLISGTNRLEAFKKGVFDFKKKPANFIFSDLAGNIWFQIRDDALYRYNPLTDLIDRFDGLN
ncbi:hypothetical protein [Dyadobacter psychrophilus]|nr:hypothetical protein [Dyadobacter psychrophilus]